MKITRRQLRRIIIEQVSLLTEEVTLADLGRSRSTINGIPYADAGAVVILGKDNPGLFDENDDNFYETADVRSMKDFKKNEIRRLKEPNTFKMQDGSSIYGEVIDYLKDKDAIIVIPVKSRPIT
jgi:hypothetical protein